MTNALNRKDRISFVQDAVEFRKGMDEDRLTKALGIAPRIGDENGDFEALVIVVQRDIETYLRFCKDDEQRIEIRRGLSCEDVDLLYISNAIGSLRQRLSSREIYKNNLN